MPRTIHADTLAHLRQRQTSVIDMVYLDILGDPVRVHSDIGSFQWDGHTWEGIGAVGAIDEVEEDDSLDAETFGIGMRFAGRSAPVMLSAIRSSNQRGRQAIVYKAARDMVTGELIGEPVIIQDGEMQEVSANVGIDGGTAVVTVLDGRALDNRSIPDAMSNESQQGRYPGDLSLKFMDDVVLFNDFWGPGGPKSKPDAGAGQSVSGIQGLASIRPHR